MKLDTPQPSDFDPYYRWLGIPKSQRPPNHYRLLGISPKEEDREVIEAAIERQTNAVKTQKTAQYEKIAARVLFEIQEAGVVILDHNRRKEYDASLARPRTQPKRPMHRAELPPYSPYKPAGEQNEIVRSYIGVMSVILGGFIIMAVVSFMLPWRRVVFGIQEPKTTIEAEEVEAAQETVRRPVVAQRPVAKVAQHQEPLVVAGSPPKAGDKTEAQGSIKKSLTTKLAGSKWMNSNNVSFEWTNDGRLLHNGVDRNWRALDERRGQITFGPNHVDTLVFNDSFTEFTQLIRGGPDSHRGWRTQTGKQGQSQSSTSDEKPVAGILEHRTNTWEKSKQNYASCHDMSFDVGMGDQPDGFGFAHAGVRLRDVRWIDLEVTMPQKFRRRDLNSFAGFIVDYHTPSGYVSRVELSTGFSSTKRWAGSPWWGKSTKPDRFVELGRRKSYALDLMKWAPSDWDGETWFSVNLQNSGRNTSFQSRITRMADKNGSPVAIEGRSKSVDE
jgi:hypothetical protein